MSPNSWRDDDLVMAWSGLLRLHARLVSAIDTDIQEASGMGLSWYDVLLELNSAESGRLRMLDLGDAVVLSRSRVSRVVDELVAAGYVERIANPEDKRSSFAQLTPQGRKAFRQAAPVYLESIRRHLGGCISESDAKNLRQILTRAVSNAGDR